MSLHRLKLVMTAGMLLITAVTAVLIAIVSNDGNSVAEVERFRNLQLVGNNKESVYARIGYPTHIDSGNRGDPEANTRDEIYVLSHKPHGLPISYVVRYNGAQVASTNLVDRSKDPQVWFYCRINDLLRACSESRAR